MLTLLLGCVHPDPVRPAGPHDRGEDSSGADDSPVPLDDTGDSAGDTAATKPPGTRLGAIRWDAWQEDGSVNAVVESTLGPAHWHDRMPWFGVETGTDSVSIRGDDAATMDDEIAWAAAAGVDYWAFVTYPASDAMTHALDLYLASARHADVGFSLVLQGGWLAYDTDDWSTQVQRYTHYFEDPAYVTVDGRPLVYLYDAASMWGTTRFADEAAATAAFAELSSASEAAGAGRPYVVLMGWDPAADSAVARDLGLDALSAYAVAGGDDGGAPYADLRYQAVTSWNGEAAYGLGVVPTVGTGWDPRPRIETPTPWAEYADAWFERPDPEEIAAHLTEALGWVDARPDAAAAGTVIAYAWNEHDEGGWLCPTWTASGPDTSRVDAVAAALDAWDARLPLQNGSFEAPPVDQGWYIVPSGGPSTSLAWTTAAPDGTYLIADPYAAHFAWAADGAQALLLSTASSVSEDVAIATAADVELSAKLLTGTYPGDTAGEVVAELLQDGNVLASTTWSTPAEPGVWQSYTLRASVQAGDVTVRLSSTSGMPWVDDVRMLRVE